MHIMHAKNLIVFFSRICEVIRKRRSITVLVSGVNSSSSSSSSSLTPPRPSPGIADPRATCASSIGVAKLRKPHYSFC